MKPTLSEGSKVLASSLPFIFSKPKTGDIIAFKKFDKVFIKRIRNIKDDEYFLKGDNDKDSYDSGNFGLVYRKNIIGKVIKIL